NLLARGFRHGERLGQTNLPRPRAGMNMRNAAMLLHRILPLLTAGAILLSCGPAPAAPIPVHPVRPPVHRTTIAHGTLANRHIHRAIAAAPKAAAKRAVVRPTAVRHVTRARRLAHVAHVHHRRGGVMGHVYSGGEPVAGATVAVAHSARAKN